MNTEYDRLDETLAVVALVLKTKERTYAANFDSDSAVEAAGLSSIVNMMLERLEVNPAVVDEIVHAIDLAAKHFPGLRVILPGVGTGGVVLADIGDDSAFIKMQFPFVKQFVNYMNAKDLQNDSTQEA